MPCVYMAIGHWSKVTHGPSVINHQPAAPDLDGHCCTARQPGGSRAQGTKVLWCSVSVVPFPEILRVATVRQRTVKSSMICRFLGILLAYVASWKWKQQLQVPELFFRESFYALCNRTRLGHFSAKQSFYCIKAWVKAAACQVQHKPKQTCFKYT